MCRGSYDEDRGEHLGCLVCASHTRVYTEELSNPGGTPSEREAQMDPRSSRLRLRVRTVMATLGIVAAMLGTSPTTSSALARVHQASLRLPHARPASSQMTLAQAPAGLQAAVRLNLGRSSAPASGVRQQA